MGNEARFIVRDYTCVDSSPITWPDLPRQNIKICVRRASVLIWFVVAKLTHGPIVGATSSNSVVIWARADVKARFKVQLDSGTSKAVALNGENDFTGVVRFNRLQPDRPYTYSVSLGGEQVAGGDEYSFKTFPKSGSGDFSFAFGSCFVPDDYGDQIFQSLAEKSRRLETAFLPHAGRQCLCRPLCGAHTHQIGLKAGRQPAPALS